MPKHHDPEEREQASVAFLMSAIAGAVDVTGYLLLFHLFTAHMSGNSAVLGADLARRRWLKAIQSGFPIPCFVLGVYCGALLVEKSLRRKALSPMIGAYFLEAVLLFCALVGGVCAAHAGLISSRFAPAYYLLGGLLTFIMGLQNATLRRVGPVQFRSTFISGMLSNFSDEAAAITLWMRDRTRGRMRQRFFLALRVLPGRAAARHLSFYGGIWVAYIIGGSLSGWAEIYWHWGALLLPLAGLIAILAEAKHRPLTGASSIEEKEK